MPLNDETDFLFENSEEARRPSTTDQEVTCVKKKISRSEPIQIDQNLEAGYYRIDVKNLDMLPRVVIPAEWGMTLKDRDGKIIKTLSGQQIGNRSAGPLIRGTQASPEATVTFKVQASDAPARIEARVTAKILVGGVLMTARLVRIGNDGGAVSPVASPAQPAASSPIATPISQARSPRSEADTPQARSYEQTQVSSSSPSPKFETAGPLLNSEKKRPSLVRGFETSKKEPSDSPPLSSSAPGSSSGVGGEVEALIHEQYMKLPKAEQRKVELFDLTPGTYRVEIVEDVTGVNQLKKHFSDVTCKLRVYMNDPDHTLVKEYKTTQAMGWKYYFRVPDKVQSHRNYTGNLALDFKSQALLLSKRYTVYVHKMPSSTVVTTDDDVNQFETQFKLASVVLGLCILKLIMDILSYPILSVDMRVVTVDITLFKIFMVVIPSWGFVHFAESKYMVLKGVRKVKKIEKEMRDMKRIKELKKAANQGVGIMDKLKNIKGAMVKMNEEKKDEKLKGDDVDLLSD